MNERQERRVDIAVIILGVAIVPVIAVLWLRSISAANALVFGAEILLAYVVVLLLVMNHKARGE
jgi:hypothetical protein